jgi:hypothetical protein
MRSLKSGLLSVIFTGFCGTAAIIGCSAEGESDLIEDQSATDPETDSTQLPPSNPGTSSGGSSSGSTGATDGGTKKDAAKDAGPPPPEPGDPCTKVDEIFKRSCGACGKQEAVCLGGGDAGGGTVSDYGVCENEVEGGCIPGTTEDVACGNCGTAKKTCNSYCAWSTSSCTGQPTNSCKPGTVEYLTAGCPVSGSYRNRTCGATCTWGSTSTVCEEPNNPNKLTIAGTVNGTVAGNYALTAAVMSKRQPTSSCGASAYLSTSLDHPYVVVEVKNATTKSATISATTAGTPAEVAGVLTAYPVTLPPTTDDELKACSKSNYNFSKWPSLSGITIGAGAKILLRVQAYDPESSPIYEATGNFTLTLKTDALN